MFTVHFWFFNKDHNIFYHHIVLASSSAEAKLVLADEIKSDKRLLEKLKDDPFEISIGYDANSISEVAVEPPSEAYYLLACTHKKFTTKQTNVAKWLRSNKSTAEILTQLDCSDQTLRNDIVEMGRKADAKGRAAIVKKLEEHARGIQKKP
jgi:DNA-binding CsgD family transcriptional regulator